MTEISRGLKNLAKELDVPVVAAAQLNREVERRTGNRRPQLSDLRESGAIKADADLVLFISREDSSKPTEEHAGMAEITVGKNRHGAAGSLQLAFLKQYTKFANGCPEQDGLCVGK